MAKEKSKKTIMVVEDDEQIVDVYKIALGLAGFEADIIMFGKEALERVKQIKEGKAKKPDMVLLDLILPDINGIAVLQEIRKNKETKNIPVFVLTNYASQDLEKMGYDLKSERYILKTDLKPSQLIELIKKEVR